MNVELTFEVFNTDDINVYLDGKAIDFENLIARGKSEGVFSITPSTVLGESD